MNSEVYTLVALAARYWFLGLILAILLRAWHMTVVDSKRARTLRRHSAQAGCIGQFLVNPGRKGPQLCAPIPREGTLGSSRNADICLKLKGRDLRRYHFSYEYRPGGILVKPAPGASAVLNGEYTGRKLFMQHGDSLQLGNVRLQLELFDSPRPQQVFDEEHIWDEEPGSYPPPAPEAPPNRRARRAPEPQPDPMEDQLKDFEDELWPDD